MNESKYGKIRCLLHQRYAPPEWMLWEELTFMSGITHRRMDMFVMSQWRSSGNMRIAIEIKTSHADFVNELKDPLKRKPAMDYSDEFYYVAPRNVIPVEELPESCGLIELNKTQLRIRRRAAQRKAEPLPVSFMIRMIGHKRERMIDPNAEYCKYIGNEITVADMKKIIEDEREIARGAERYRKLDALEKEALSNPILDYVRSKFHSYQGDDNGILEKLKHFVNAKEAAMKREELRGIIKTLDGVKEKIRYML